MSMISKNHEHECMGIVRMIFWNYAHEFLVSCAWESESVNMDFPFSTETRVRI